jgi:hypothetical protein
LVSALRAGDGSVGLVIDAVEDVKLAVLVEQYLVVDGRDAAGGTSLLAVAQARGARRPQDVGSRRRHNRPAANATVLSLP